MDLRRAATLAAAVAALTLGGCTGVADDAPSPGVSPASPSPSGSPVPSPAPSAAPSPSASPSASPSVPAPTGSSPAGDAPEATLSGRVAEGVEAGCLVLRSGGRDYLLVVPPSVDRAALRPGSSVVVTGRTRPDLVSYCQQGTPFVVSGIDPG